MIVCVSSVVNFNVALPSRNDDGNLRVARRSDNDFNKRALRER